jgi:hypothetical protein
VRRRPLLSLRELQDEVRRALLDGASERAAALVAADGLAGEARLAVYRHHVFTSLTAALASTFPVVCRLVDRRFFAYAADAFVRAHPPRGPCLFEYGAELADFLADFPASRPLEYLPDVARLEWAMNVAAHADDVATLPPAALASLDPGRVGALRFGFAPWVTLLRSPWPIAAIWRANQAEAGDEPTVDLAAGGVCLQIRRDGDAVAFDALTEGGYTLRRALLDGHPLGAAVEAARAVGPEFHLAEELAALLRQRVLTGAGSAPGDPS